MLIDFPKTDENIFPNFKGGEKEYAARRFSDGQNAVMRGRLIPGASIGMHTHETSSEVIYILSGTASILCDGKPETLTAGQCHYCPKGSTHTMKNNGTDELTFFAVVPEQYFNFSAEDIVSFQLSSGDLPVRYFVYDGKKLQYFNRIHPRDGGMRYPDGFFETKIKLLTSEQHNNIRSVLRDIDFTALRTSQNLRSRLGDCGFTVQDTFSFTTSQGLCFDYLSNDVPPDAIRSLFSLLCDICGIDASRPIQPIDYTSREPGKRPSHYAICPKCSGITLKAGHFCRKCGEDLTKYPALESTDPTDDPDATLLLCPHCNAPVVPLTDVYCYHCGEKLPWEFATIP